jgi:hypothetical protein
MIDADYEATDVVVEMAWQAILSAQGQHVDHWLKGEGLSGVRKVKRDEHHTAYLMIKIDGKDAGGT